MRRIEISEEAIKRHEATLGKTILAFLERLKNGGKVWWQVDASKGKKQDELHKEMVSIVDNALKCSDYWKWLYDQFQDKKILTAKPIDLATFTKDEAAEKNKITDKNEAAAVDTICKKLFNYADFRKSKVLVEPNTSGLILWSQEKKNIDSWNGWGIAEFVRLLDVRYCPYCNAETVGTAMLPGRIHLPDIDHIFPKKKYPLLSLSLYNLVPACNRCNSRFKKSKDMLDDPKALEVPDMLKTWNKQDDKLPALHPYVDNVHRKIRFDYSPKSVENLFIRPHVEDSPLTVSAVDSDERVGHYIDTYYLKQIYRDVYAEEINEMIRMEAICSKDFIDTMKDLYKLDDLDFDKLFRRSSLDPRKINHFRFAKLIIDLHHAIGSDIDARKKQEIEARLREKFRL